MDWISNPEIWTALVTLTALEIVLGIDNIIFISILAGKLPTEPEQKRARTIGLMGALVMRVLLLLLLRQFPGQNRDEDDVIDPEYNLENG